METNEIQKYRSALAILGILLLIPGFASAQEKSVKLKISVSNTSLEQSQEIDVNINLPKELTKDDVISSDGLKIGYDEGTKGLVAKDKVTLQPAETTFFYVVARDVWLLPEEDIRLLRTELDSFRISTSEYYVQQQMGELIKQIDQILAEQKEEDDDTSLHIQAYRKHKQKLDEIKDSLLAVRQLHDNKQVQKKGLGFSINERVLLNGALFLILGLSSLLFYWNNKRIMQYIHKVQLEDYLKIAHLFNPIDLECKLLINQEDGPWAEKIALLGFPSSRQGRVFLFLEESYRSQTVLEIKVPLGSVKRTVLLRGPIIWQRKITDNLPRAYYLTGIIISEIAQDDLQKLKQFIESHI